MALVINVLRPKNGLPNIFRVAIGCRGPARPDAKSLIGQHLMPMNIQPHFQQSSCS
jgi:hypothetical protein